MRRKPECPRCQGAGSIDRPGPRRRKNLQPTMACPDCGGTGHPKEVNEMNPNTNRFEHLTEGAGTEEQQRECERAVTERLRRMVARTKDPTCLLRPDGTPVPKHWSVFRAGEEVTIKDYTFKVAYIGETAILFEPVKPKVIVDG